MKLKPLLLSESSNNTPSVEQVTETVFSVIHMMLTQERGWKENDTYGSAFPSSDIKVWATEQEPHLYFTVECSECRPEGSQLPNKAAESCVVVVHLTIEDGSHDMNNKQMHSIDLSGEYGSWDAFRNEVKFWFDFAARKVAKTAVDHHHG